MNALISIPDLPPTKLIIYPRFQRLRSMFEDCYRLTQVTGESKCMALEGREGAGKTKLIEDFVADYPPIVTPTGREVPVLYVETPDNPTLLEAISEALKSLGDPTYEAKRTEWKAKRDLRNMIKKCKVRLMIWDDIQHMSESQKVNRKKLSEWLKTLIKKTKVTAIIVGIDGEVTGLLNANRQLSRLFARREKLPPFRWDENETETIEEFANLISMIESSNLSIPLINTNKAELYSRICYCTEGIMGNIMNLIRTAEFLADGAKAKEIGLEFLSQAFDTHLKEHVEIKSNPFDLPLSDKFVWEDLPKKSDTPK